MFKSLLNNSRGGSTLEASLIFPTVMIIIFGLIFFSVYIYQKFVLFDTAVYSATQSAFTWDNTAKNIEDGALQERSEKDKDGLYWRFFDYPVFKLAASKVTKAQDYIYHQINSGIFQNTWADAEVSYSNHIVDRTVLVDINQGIAMPLKGLSPAISARAESKVVEPAEFIRNVNLAVNYSGPLTDGLKKSLQKFLTNDQKASPILYASSAIKNNKVVKVYHTNPDCKYRKRIKSENLITFNDYEVANKNGYYLCTFCASGAYK